VALLAWIGYIHLHLWQEGYRHIPTNGPLFLLDAVAGFVLVKLPFTAEALASFPPLTPEDVDLIDIPEGSAYGRMAHPLPAPGQCVQRDRERVAGG
jgi:hypothetical protein